MPKLQRRRFESALELSAPSDVLNREDILEEIMKKAIFCAFGLAFLATRRRLLGGAGFFDQTLPGRDREADDDDHNRYR